MHTSKHDILNELLPEQRLLLLDECVTHSLGVDEVVRAALGRGPWSAQAKFVADMLAKSGKVDFEKLKGWPYDCACGAIVDKLSKCHVCGGACCASCETPKGCPKCVAEAEAKRQKRLAESKQ